MPARPASAVQRAEPEAARPGKRWTFVGQCEPPALIPNEPISVRHTDPPVLWRLSFEPPLQADWHALELGFGPSGIVDARLILILADGSRLPQPLPKIGRNRSWFLFRPIAPVSRLEVELTGTARLDAPLLFHLRSVSAWERRRALLGRALSVLRGDPRSFPWRLARVLVQLKRQGRSVIPPAPPSGSAETDYRVWRERFDERDDDAAWHRERLRLRRRVAFTVIGAPDLTPQDAEALRQSLVAQVYDGWELFSPHPDPTDPRIHALRAVHDQVGTALAEASGAFVLLPRPGTRLRPHALAVFAAAADRWPGAELIYADDDDLVAGERAHPRFKPAWSPTRLSESNYIGDPHRIGADRLRRCWASIGPDAGTQARLLGLTAGLAPTAVVHVAQVLSHGTASPPCPRTRPTHPATAPLVSLIIPTRDRADLLRLSVGSIRAKTVYPRYEIIVVDNGSREPQTLRLFEEWSSDPTIRILHDPRPFNYAALNNGAVTSADGEVVGLINNDIEVLDPAWLDEMVRALRPGVGCVGAKLFYPDGRLQHGGVVTGIAGAAGHRRKRAAPDATGMLDELVTVNEVSAVTAACLLVRKTVYSDVGGLDETTFPVAYNDVDFCLKVLRAGYRNLWTPFATLVHHESVSRGRDLSPATAERFNRENLALRLRWADRLLADPYYSPNLTLDAETGTIRTQ